MSSLNEASLVLRNDLGKNFFDSVCYNCGDDFVPSIAERYRTESGEVLGTFLLGIKARNEELVLPPIFLQFWDFLTILTIYF